MPHYNPSLILRTQLLSLTISISLLRVGRPLVISCASSYSSSRAQRLGIGTSANFAAAAATTTMASTITRRQSPRSSTRLVSSKTTSRYFSSSMDGNNSGNDTVSGSTAMQMQEDDNIQSSTKRKIKSQASTSSKKKKKTISAPASSTAVKRTKSFEPAWWGNVMTVKGGASLHSHATTAAATAASSTIAHANNASTSNTSFPPVHTLILGTHPSTTSLEKNEMFAHPQNAFWYIAGDVLGFRRSLAVSTATGKPYASFHSHLRYDEDEIIEYPQQLERLVSKGFAMWDIVAECKREGSLDNDIQDEIPNRIREFCEGTLYNTDDGNSIDTAEHLCIKRIVIANGTTGGQLFVKHFSDWFMDGKLRAANDEMSQRVLKAVMNKSKKSNNGISEHSIEVVCLPSVSPAAASFTYLEKRDAWEKGCYDPGLADYHRWNQSKGRSEKLRQSTPDMIKSHATPTKQTKSKSPKALTTPSPSKVPTARLFSSDLAKLTPENDWIDLEVSPEELRPSATLTNGQCFNWLVVENESDTADATPSPQKSAWGTHNANEWVGPIQNRVLSIKETPATTMCRVLCGPTDNVKEDLRRYFRLEIPLAPLYDEWSRQDARLSKIAKSIPGVRILRQDPIECMFSFICSSNNNIPRITKMLSSFREKYGTFMMELPIRNVGGDSTTTSIFQFPTLATLANATEEELRAIGLGYRAKYMIETRDLLAECGGDDYLQKLRTTPDSQTVQDELIKFSGIGRKVADCIALFSLDQDDAIPVDVHVQHICSRDYDPTVLGEAKSITPTIYKRVGDLFRDRFTNYPGWAHSLLFVAELPSFRDVLPIEVVREMDDWRGLEQMKKLEKKDGNKKQSI